MGLTPAIAGAMPPAVFAGAVALADLAGTDVPAVAEKELLAVAEVCSSADDAKGSPSVIRVNSCGHWDCTRTDRALGCEEGRCSTSCWSADGALR